MSNDLISIPLSLGLVLQEELKKLNIEPRVDKYGMRTPQFTREELEKITSLTFENPTRGELIGIDLLPNLKSLTIKSTGHGSYTQEKNLYSISNEDARFISKCKNLEFLEISNQTKLEYIDVGKLEKLKVLDLTNNSRLESLDGLDLLTNLYEIDCIGNESLTMLENLDEVILKNSELCDLKLDLLLYPDAIGFSLENINGRKEVLDKFQLMTVTWEEILSNSEFIKINNVQMQKMHEKACEALSRYVPEGNNKLLSVLGIELFLAENVVYDNNSIKDESHTHSGTGIQIGNKVVNIASGPIGGANGAYNAFMINTCVCEGYTRAMQYLLRLKGIKSHNVHCISGEDTYHMSTDKGDDMYKRYNLPDDGYHSIISIDDLDYLYDANMY